MSLSSGESIRPPLKQSEQRSRDASKACGDAVTRVVRRQPCQSAQIWIITLEPRLVTITVGGKDIGYIDDLSQPAACHTCTLFGRLAGLFGAERGPRQNSFTTRFEAT